MKLLIISPNIFPIPLQGYGGLEQIVFLTAVGLAAKGHQVTVVAPQGSQLPDGVELIPTVQGEPEEGSWHRYSQRMQAGEFDCIVDHTWEKWAYVSSSSRDPELPIMGILHTAPGIYQTPPPVLWPCLVGLSEQHARDQRLHLKVDCRVAYNGIDTAAFYTPDPSVKRNDHYLAFGRYTAEKGMLQAMNIARRTRVRLDCFGDTTIVGDQGYVERCRQAADGLRVRFNGPVSRQDSLRLYRGAKALLFPLQWSEPFGLAIIEAMACGMPVLTLRRGAMPELVEHGVSGFVYDTEDELEQAIRDDVVAKLDPAKIRASAERFTIQRMVDRHEALAQDVVAGKGW